VPCVEEMNGNDITAVEEFCIMDCKPIITCKYTNFMSYVALMSTDVHEVTFRNSKTCDCW
jgi:hypothetical protein